MEQVAASHWLVGVQETWAATAAGVFEYAQGDNLGFQPGIEYAEITDLTVGSWVGYDRIGNTEMKDLLGARVSMSFGSGGVWSMRYVYNFNLTPPTMVPLITIQPTPATSGTFMAVSGAIVPGALTDDGTSTPLTPPDFHGSLIDGTAAIVLRRVDERPDLATSHEQAFQAAIPRLLARRNQYARGRGPAQIQVPGYHWSG